MNNLFKTCWTLIVDRWCKKWKLAINQGKTKVLHFRPNSVIRSQYSFKCGDINVEYDTKYRYLGLWINDNLDFRYTVKEIAKSASRALSALYTKHLSCGGFSYDVYTKLYRSMVEPVLYYGASIWRQSEWKEINTVQNKACRYFLGSAKKFLQPSHTWRYGVLFLPYKSDDRSF